MMAGADRQRLDTVLVERRQAASRARARDAIRRGCVRVNGAVVIKPATLVDDASDIAVDDPAGGYVSRAALKLIAGLDHFGFEVKDRNALDLGASTGGFTQVLLERGAAHVHAVDVGHDQFHETLANEQRISLMERINARDLTGSMLDRPINAIVCDVSFISLKLALPPALDLCAPGAWGIFLIKPQFEVGRDHVGKDGVVRDEELLDSVRDDFGSWLNGRSGWRVIGTHASPIAGGDGNTEFLLGAQRDE